MKKFVLPFLCVALMLSFSGCADNGATGRITPQNTGVKDILQSGIASENEKTAPTTTSETTAETTVTPITVAPPEPSGFDDVDERFKGTKGIDIDLTKGNANLVYAQVYDMMYSPDSYIGKKIKMEGTFTYYHNEETDKYYYACFIADAAACCQQGIEFEPAKKVKFPDDFPKVGAKISVTGVFYTYKEGDNTFAALKDATYKTV